MALTYRKLPNSNNLWVGIYIFILGGFGGGLGRNIYIYHIQLSVALYEFLGGSEGFGRGLGHDIYIYRHSKGC